MQQHSTRDTRTESPTAAADPIPVVPLRHPVRLAVAVVLILVALSAAWDVAVNQRYHWDVVVSYLFAPQIIAGAGLTILLTVVSMTAGIALGTLLAIMRLSENPILRTISRGYIWFFRGTPLLVQLIFWYNIAALYPVIAFGLPFGGPSVVLGSANVLISPLAAALLGLSLNEAAYMAEIIRGGLLSVDKGQVEATDAFGMTRSRALRRVIIPQAMRSIVPPTGNQLISMIKATSLVSVIAMADLLYSVQAVYNRTFEVIPMLMVAVIWYLVITSVLNIGQGFIERYYARGERGSTQAKPVIAEATP